MLRTIAPIIVLLAGLPGCQSKVVTYADGIVASFESKQEIQPDEGTATVAASQEHVTHGQYSLHAKLEGPESGFGFRPVGEKTWDFSSARKLLFDVYREGTPISLIVRAFDADDKPYVVWYYRLLEGANVVEIDLVGMGKMIDTSRISRLYLYVEDGSGDVFVDHVRLLDQPLDLESLIAKPTPHPRQTPEGNGLLNGDFEVGMTGWGSWGEWDDGRYFFGSGFNEDACSGLASLKITCERRGRGGVFTEPMYMPAGVYEFRFFAKGGPKGSLLRWSFAGDDAARAAVEQNFESEIIPLELDWTEYRYVVPIRDNVALRLYFFSVGEGAVYIDAASLVLRGKEERPPYQAPAGKSTQIVRVEGSRFTLDGKPFFPIGAYLGKPSMLEGTGFNCMMPSMMTPEIIEESAQLGILLTPELTGVLRAHLPWQVGVAMTPYKNHPQLFGWYMCDEPDHAMFTVPPPEMRLANRQAHELDPDRPTWAVVMSWADSNMFQYADTVDVLATDIYPIEDETNKKPLVMVAEKTDVLKQATGPNRPGIVVLQSSKKVHPDEEVAMTYLALTHGANGLFYWQLFEAQEDPNVWRTMVNLTREIRALTPVLHAPDAGVSVGVSDKRIHTLTRQLGNRIYVLTVNESPEPISVVRFRHPRIVGEPVKVLFEERDIAMAEDGWTDEFAGYARHVYSVPVSNDSP